MIKEEVRYEGSARFEGAVSVSAVLHAADTDFNDRRVLRIYYDGARKEKLSRTLAYYRACQAVQNFELIETDCEIVDRMALGTSHGGIVAECTDRTVPTLEKLRLPERGFYVFLEGIEDPYNFGSAVRTLYAAGVDGIVLSPRNWMSAGGVVCRSSAGASELLPLYIGEADSVAEVFHASGYKIVAAGIRDSVSVYDADLSLPLLLAVGGEKRGLSRAFLDIADITVRLEYGREFRGSVSASAASSVLAYEIYRQNRPD